MVEIPLDSLHTLSSSIKQILSLTLSLTRTLGLFQYFFLHCAFPILQVPFKPASISLVTKDSVATRPNHAKRIAIWPLSMQSPTIHKHKQRLKDSLQLRCWQVMDGHQRCKFVHVVGEIIGKLVTRDLEGFNQTCSPRALEILTHDVPGSRQTPVLIDAPMNRRNEVC